MIFCKLSGTNHCSTLWKLDDLRLISLGDDHYSGVELDTDHECEDRGRIRGAVENITLVDQYCRIVVIFEHLQVADSDQLS
jgi:hypothetical protein